MKKLISLFFINILIYASNDIDTITTPKNNLESPYQDINTRIINKNLMTLGIYCNSFKLVKIYEQYLYTNEWHHPDLSKRMVNEQLITLGIYYVTKFSENRFQAIQIYHAQKIGPEFTQLVKDYGLTPQMLQLTIRKKNRPFHFINFDCMKETKKKLRPAPIPMGNTFVTDPWNPTQLEQQLLLKEFQNQDFVDNDITKIDNYMSNIYDKDNQISRLLNAIEMKKQIKLHKLNLLDMADKRIVYINGRWKILAEKIDPSVLLSANSISIDLIKEILTFRQRTGYSDWKDNWRFNTDTKKLTCIDTEDLSFSANLTLKSSITQWKKYMDKNALEYFKKNYKEKSIFQQLPLLSLLDDNETNNENKYNQTNDDTINIQKVRVELEKKQLLKPARNSCQRYNHL